MFKLVPYRHGLTYICPGTYTGLPEAVDEARLTLIHMMGYDKVEVVRIETGEVVYTAEWGRL